MKSMKSKALIVVVGSCVALVLGATAAAAADYSSPKATYNGVWSLNGCSVTVSHSNGIVSGTAYANKPSPCLGKVRVTAYGYEQYPDAGGTTSWSAVSKTSAWFSIDASQKIGQILRPAYVESHSATRRV